MNLDALREWLEANGFVTSEDPLRSQYNECDWYAYRRSKIIARRCECNDHKDGVQIVVTPYSYTPPNYSRHESVEIQLTAQAGVWWQLKAYSMSPDDVPALLDQIETSLVSAWNVIQPTRKEQDE